MSVFSGTELSMRIHCVKKAYFYIIFSKLASPRENRPRNFFCSHDCAGLERKPSRYCKCDGKVTFTRPFLRLGKVTFDKHARNCKGDIYGV